MSDQINDKLNKVDKIVKKAAKIHDAAEAKGFDWSLIPKPPSRPTNTALYFSLGTYTVSVIVIYFAASTQAFPLLFLATLATIAWVAFTAHCIYEQRFATILISIFGFCILLVASNLVPPQETADAFKAWLESLGK